MRRVDPLVIGLAVCAAGALGLLLWPLPQPASPPRPADGVYRGPEHQTLEVAARAGGAILRLSASAEPAAAPPPAAAPTLVGIIGGREAYLRSATSGEVVRVTPGALIEGWRVAGIDGRSLTLVMGSERRRLRMFDRPEQPAAPLGPGTPQGG
jgi:hypothetical protein